MHRGFLFFALWAFICPAQTPEITSTDEAVVFESKVDLVTVPVVVRDRQGTPVGNLTQEDFQILDRGKPQVISKFSIEKTGGAAIARTASPPNTPADAAAKDAPPVIAPDRFVGLLFDDVHSSFGELSNTRTAAQRLISTALQPASRIAIFTTSGQTTLEFTDDRERLNETLLRLAPHPIARSTTQDCPDVSFYQSDQIVNRHNQDALAAAAREVIVCMSLGPNDMATALQIARAKAMQVLQAGEHETAVSLSTIRDVVRRMAVMPGQRTLILASPGFLPLDAQFQDESSLIDFAIHSGVIINALDVRGLYTNSPDASYRVIAMSAERTKRELGRESALLQSGVLDELAAGTGGTLIQNTNDLNAGLKQLGAAPEVFYLLGFSPRDMKPDGAFHPLKIGLKNPSGLTVKARLGYYAPRHLADAGEQAKEEIGEAVFSRDEIRDLPVDLNTQFFKTGDYEAKLIVLSKIDVGKLKFRKDADRNVDDVEIVCALFDHNGNYIQAFSKTVKMRLLDRTLQRGITGGL
ncbi:MAG: VWA domain-containing protein, partial [Acidobacteriota bacterium]|nr:VWA domain-containing protein [Acidobacteriota bacterium]